MTIPTSSSQIAFTVAFRTEGLTFGRPPISLPAGRSAKPGTRASCRRKSGDVPARIALAVHTDDGCSWCFPCSCCFALVMMVLALCFCNKIDPKDRWGSMKTSRILQVWGVFHLKVKPLPKTNKGWMPILLMFSLGPKRRRPLDNPILVPSAIQL